MCRRIEILGRLEKNNELKYVQKTWAYGSELLVTRPRPQESEYSHHITIIAICLAVTTDCRLRSIAT
jgi:hypothetical protein